MRVHKLALVLFGCLALSPASAQTKAYNESVVAHNQGAASAFEVQSDGGVRHIQSDLVCPSDFPSTHLADVQIYSTSPDVGTDVGCDYARLTGDNVVVSKLTVFFVKANNSTTLDSAFGRYRDEIMSANPGAEPMSPALHISDPATHADRADYRAVGFTVSVGANHYHSELIVGLTKGWIVEVRASYPNSVIKADPHTTKQELADQLYDIENTYVAYMHVMGIQ